MQTHYSPLPHRKNETPTALTNTSSTTDRKSPVLSHEGLSQGGANMEVRSVPCRPMTPGGLR
jgi:hypothetical protein